MRYPLIARRRNMHGSLPQAQLVPEYVTDINGPRFLLQLRAKLPPHCVTVDVMVPSEK